MPKDKTNKEKNREQTKAKEDCAEDISDAKQLKPVRPKIGESADNLKQREEWFQKRSGRKQ